MIVPILTILAGLIVLIWSADRFVASASDAAYVLGVSPILIGMIIMGFGTSSPEMLISAMAATQGNSGLSIGNVVGSNISNIALILGIAAVIKPITVESNILRVELPLLSLMTILLGWCLHNGVLSRIDAAILFTAFFCLMLWTIYQRRHEKMDELSVQTDEHLAQKKHSLREDIIWVVVALALMIISSRSLVWGGVEIAEILGVPDLIIGLTIVAIGTSLPELASTITAVRQGHSDMAMGGIIGSNLFNTLVVVGISGMIRPFDVPEVIITRDFPFMALLTLSLFVIGYGYNKNIGRINRVEGALLVFVYVAYMAYIVHGLAPTINV